MSTGILFAGATQDDEFEDLLQSTFKQYDAEDPFSDLLLAPATIRLDASVTLLPLELSPSVSPPNLPQQTSKVVAPQKTSDMSSESQSVTDHSDHESDDQDYKPKRVTKRKPKQAAKVDTPSDVSTSEKPTAEKKPKERSLIHDDDYKDCAKGIERLKKALTKCKEDALNETIPGELNPVQVKIWRKKEKNKQSAQVSRYNKAIAELEEKNEAQKLHRENEKLTANNRALLRANAELNSRLMIMQNTPPDTTALTALTKEVASLKSTHEGVLKSFTELKDQTQTLHAQSEKQEKESAETIDILCKKLTALKEVESYSHDLENQILELSTEKKQLEKMLEEAKKAKEQAEVNQHTLNQTFQTLVARHEAELQVEKQKMTAAETERKTYVTKMRTKFEEELRPLQAREASLTANDAEQARHIQWLQEKVDSLESEYLRQREECADLGDILQRREHDFTKLEAFVGNLEEGCRRDRAYIQDLEAEVASLRPIRNPNPPLIYSSRAPIDRFYRLQSQTTLGPPANAYPGPKRSKFS